MLNLQKKYQLPAWADMAKAAPPAEAPVEDAAAAFEKLYNLPPGKQAAMLDFDGFEILISAAMVNASRKPMQQYFRRVGPCLQKPTEVWVEIVTDGSAAYNYLKAYDDGWFEVHVADGAAAYYVLKSGDEWANRQRAGALVYTAQKGE